MKHDPVEALHSLNDELHMGHQGLVPPVPQPPLAQGQNEQVFLYSPAGLVEAGDGNVGL